MSIDVTWHPITETYAVGNAAAQNIPGAVQRGCTTVRIRNIAPSNASVAYISWGPNAAALLAAGAVAPTLGAPSYNTIGIAGNVTATIEVPMNSFFISSIAWVAATSGFEITGGIGGSGA
jgi:hypothetical protein